jgi:hypothetical protein
MALLAVGKVIVNAGLVDSNYRRLQFFLEVVDGA